MNEEPIRNRERDPNRPISPSDPSMPEHDPDTPPTVGVYDRPARSSSFPVWLVILILAIMALLVYGIFVLVF